MPTEHIEIRLSGVGGQGQVLGGEMLARALGAAGLQVAFSRSYEPTSRGGLSRADVVASRSELDYPLATALDRLVILDQLAATASLALLSANSVVLADSERVPRPPQGDFRVCPLPFAAVAKSLGNARGANIVALGALVALGTPCSLETLATAVSERIPERYRDANLAALRAGHDLAITDRGAVRAPTAATST